MCVFHIAIIVNETTDSENYSTDEVARYAMRYTKSCR